jgi:hypothetical protein
MRDVALKEEMKMCHSNEQEDFGNEFTPTLLGLSSSLSRFLSSLFLSSIPGFFFRVFDWK